MTFLFHPPSCPPTCKLPTNRHEGPPDFFPFCPIREFPFSSSLLHYSSTHPPYGIVASCCQQRSLVFNFFGDGCPWCAGFPFAGFSIFFLLLLGVLHLLAPFFFLARVMCLSLFTCPPIPWFFCLPLLNVPPFFLLVPVECSLLCTLYPFFLLISVFGSVIAQ